MGAVSEVGLDVLESTLFLGVVASQAPVTVGLEVIAALSEVLLRLEAAPVREGACSLFLGDFIDSEMAGVVLGLEVYEDVIGLEMVAVDLFMVGVAPEMCAVGLELPVVLEMSGVALEVVRVWHDLAPVDLEIAPEIVARLSEVLIALDTAPIDVVSLEIVAVDLDDLEMSRFVFEVVAVGLGITVVAW